MRGRVPVQQHEGGRDLSCPCIQEVDFGPEHSLVGQIHIECLLQSCSMEVYRTIKGKMLEQEGEWMQI